MRYARSWLIGSVLALTAVQSGCVDERVVFRDRELLGDLPQEHMGFVGLSDQDANLTVCGNCHISFQGEWEETGHAEAWATLQGSGSAQTFCENCHSVNQLGNRVEEPGGYATTGDERYHNVQCESCHGPGLEHVQNPSDETVPLAPLAVGVDLSTGCGECHSGAHHPFVEEWSESRHANVQTAAADRAECMACHTGEGALESWGVHAEYAEKDSVAQPGQHIAISCAVCHDPHSADNPGQLRFRLDIRSEEENLCIKCHRKRGTPDMASQNRGPHSPEGPVLLGYGGWWPPNLQFPSAGDTAIIAVTHGSVANPRLCAGCHVNAFTAPDTLKGGTITSTGHLFKATPCMVGGQPVPGDCPAEERSYQACVQCHGSEEVARSLEGLAEFEINLLATELDALIEQIPATEFNPSDGRYSTAEGALFNYQLALWPGSSIHNPFLIRALLNATIAQVEEDYNVTAPSSSTALELHGR